jgi:hypothetical protein
MTEVPFRPRDDRPVYCSDCYGDLRKKQEAQEAAEATAAAARISTAASRTSGLEPLEGEELRERNVLAEPLPELAEPVAELAEALPAEEPAVTE